MMCDCLFLSGEWDFLPEQMKITQYLTDNQVKRNGGDDVDLVTMR